jgi:hypothetical protein
VIKVWLLVVFFTSPDLPSIRHMAELYFSEEICISNKEKRGPWIEEFATKQGHTTFSYDMHCIETMMFPHIPKKNI